MPWLQLIIDLDDLDPEAVEEALLDLGALSVTYQDAEDQPIFEPDPGHTPLWTHTRLFGLFDAGDDPDRIGANLQQRFGDGLRWRTEVLEDRDWTRAWMDGFKPMRFGQRLWIVPEGYEPPAPEAVNLRLDPGLAFGTGTHPTTALCLEWLDGAELAGKGIIDYGCGSGVLGIAALLLGAERVLGVDNDPQALIATRDNAAKNAVESRVTTALPEQAGDQPAPVLLANILAGPLLQLAPRLSALTAPDGDIVLSGILESQVEEIRSAYQAWFDMDAPVVREGWVLLTGRRRA